MLLVQSAHLFARWYMADQQPRALNLKASQATLSGAGTISPPAWSRALVLRDYTAARLHAGPLMQSGMMVGR